MQCFSCTVNDEQEQQSSASAGRVTNLRAGQCLGVWVKSLMDRKKEISISSLLVSHLLYLLKLELTK